MDCGPLPGHSLFTGCLIEGLHGGIAQHGELVTGSQIALYLQKRVTSYPQSVQTPDFGTLEEDKRGELVIQIVGPLEDQPVALPTIPIAALHGASCSRIARIRMRRLLFAVIEKILMAMVITLLVTTKDASVYPPPITPPITPPIASPKPTPPKSGVIENKWVRVDPPATPYVLGVPDRTPSEQLAFRISRGVFTPSRPYAIQEHEVTWSELDPWLAANDIRVDRPTWAALRGPRAPLPATGVTWSVAAAYCQFLDGALPTEEQWEYAARGPERRPNPWGIDLLDREITHVFAGSNAVPSPVMANLQDQTPRSASGSIFDLAGNVQEWTRSLWREDVSDNDKPAPPGETRVRAIRGFPLASTTTDIQQVSAAYREPLCAAGPCVEKTHRLLAYVGFRCAKWIDK